MLYPLLGALVGYARSRRKRDRILNAVLYGVGAHLVVTQALPRLGVSLPRIG